ncbi:CHC2 zinc finger domain-containing protein [Solidesulfovibrio sp.]
MGIAEKKLSPIERRDIALALLPGAKDAANGRLQALCPFHADSQPSFYYCYAEDWYRCYGCDERGDLCRLFSRLHNLNDSDGFVEFSRRYLGGLEKRGQGPYGYAVPSLPKPAAAAPRFTPGDPPPAPEVWAARARKFADYAHEQLFDPANAPALAYLLGRGLTEATIREHQLGWNPKDYFRPKQAWGMPPEKKPNGQWRHLRLARGWVIPTIVDGTVWRLKIRQPNEVLQADEREAKYLQVPGGCQRTWILRPDRRVFVLVETEFDALLVLQAAGDLVGAVPLGSASARPDKEAFPKLRDAALLINALDDDEAGGKNTWNWWVEQFPRNHERCPTPEGKDLGEYVAAGGDVRAWVLACLPPALRQVMTSRRVNHRPAQAAEPVAPVNEPALSVNDSPPALQTPPAPVAARRPRSIEEAEERMRRELGDTPLREQTLELSLLLRTSSELHAVATPDGGMALRYPPGWDRKNDERFRRTSRLFFGDAGLAYIQYVELPVRPEGWKPENR